MFPNNSTCYHFCQNNSKRKAVTSSPSGLGQVLPEFLWIFHAYHITHFVKNMKIALLKQSPECAIQYQKVNKVQKSVIHLTN